MSESPRVHIFGIRHHGPGSAGSLLEALTALEPDVLLVEGPPDAAGVLPLLAHAEMNPPVALLVYQLDAPEHAVYYPFAEFSPEWQAIRYGLAHHLPVRFMDLPQAHMLPLRCPDISGDSEEPVGETPIPSDLPTPSDAGSEPEDPQTLIANRPSRIADDPLGWLSRAAGYGDGERWWEQMVEQRRDATDLFQGILEAMSALREGDLPEEDPLELKREAFMRKTIRSAEREGFARIAVVCGAWHAPALATMPPSKEDEALLKGLPKVKVGATWTPWTNGRLSFASGYGAGIHSPGWYGHLWRTGREGLSPTHSSIHWLTRVARLLRDEDLDASPAQIIEAVRLGEALAAMRDRPLPGLEELNEASLTVFCFGNELPMQLINEKLIIGEAMGRVPDETPLAPLQVDLSREQKRLRLPAEATQRVLDLDLRKPNDRDRSRLLHRLNLLEIPWGIPEQVSGKSGTFHEVWRLQWDPLFTVHLIEAGVWGSTIGEAAESKVRQEATRAPNLSALTHLLNGSILAELLGAVEYVMGRLQAEAALATDVADLMDALPPLADVLRYGDVRGTDPALVERVTDGLVARIAIGLPGACASMNDEAAEAMFDRLIKVNGAVTLMDNEGYRTVWHDALLQMADMEGIHGMIGGRSGRLLLDGRVFGPEEAARRLSLALSHASEPSKASAWIEGFLSGSGILLLHDDALREILDSWVTSLKPDVFQELLPLLRRTFSTFQRHERRQIGERIKQGQARSSSSPASTEAFDGDRAEAVLPLVARLLGLETRSPTHE